MQRQQYDVIRAQQNGSLSNVRSRRRKPLLFILVAQGPSLQRTRIVGNRKKPNGGCLNIYGSEIRQKGVISSDKSSFCTSHRSTMLKSVKTYPLDDFDSCLEGHSNARTAIQCYCLDTYFSRVKRGTK